MAVGQLENAVKLEQEKMKLREQAELREKLQKKGE